LSLALSATADYRQAESEKTGESAKHFWLWDYKGSKGGKKTRKLGLTPFDVSLP